MSICIRDTSDLGTSSPYWNGWDFNVDDAVVRYCREAFKKRYREYWIYPVYIDDTYMRFTQDFFKEVGVELLPRLSKLPPKPPRPEGRNPYSPRHYLINPHCPNISEWDAWYCQLDEYRAEVWSIVWGDYRINMRRGRKPIQVVVKGIRFPSSTDKEKIEERFLSVQCVSSFSNCPVY